MPVEGTEFFGSLGQPLLEGSPASPQARLLSALINMRQRALVLAGEINRNLPSLTVHDHTHFDALWELSNALAGPRYSINPAETFALGAAFLLHDLGLGLAAWPGGLATIKTGPGWTDALVAELRSVLGRAPKPEEVANPPSAVEQAAIAERLRLLHAEQAESLAFASFSDPRGGATYFLIDDPDLRDSLGPLLGRIAHSHWWPVSRLAPEFGTVIGALPTCPADWTIDPLRVATLLRTADAAQLDPRRAPGFLRALRAPSGIARYHWLFQQRLFKPRVEGDRLVYTSSPFPHDEADAWWLCRENLLMVDSELQQVDSLLSDLHRPQLRARRVAGVESTSRLRDFIKVVGWTPVDARIHISNVAGIVRQLGGEHLYGRDATVPLRELIQNAADAVRARRLLEGRGDDWGRITVRLGSDPDAKWLEVEDTGVGMSEAVLTGPLLDFGTTYWGSLLMREEHEGLWAAGFEPTGHFGVGFFSVFMWGRRVRVTTRPYAAAATDTEILEFETGPDARPHIRPAPREERVLDGGTCVRVWLERDPEAERGLLVRPDPWDGSVEVEDLGTLCGWLAPALDVDLFVEDRNGARRVVAASDWLTLDGAELLSRLSLRRFSWNSSARAAGPLMRPILFGPDGAPTGRAAIFEDGGLHVPSTSPASLGVLTVGGLRAQQVDGIAGILLGTTDRAARNAADPIADSETLANWASDQATLIASHIVIPALRFTCCSSVIAWGGQPGDLPLAKRGDEFVNFDVLATWEDAPDEIALFPFPLTFSSIAHEGWQLDANVLGITYLSGIHAPGPLGVKRSTSWIREALAVPWGCLVEDILVSSEYRNIGVRRGKEEQHRVDILRKPRGGPKDSRAEPRIVLVRRGQQNRDRGA